MNEKQAKKFRKEARKYLVFKYKEFYDFIREYKFWWRVRVCWEILWLKKKEDKGGRK